jgi:hypothetical protein
MTTLEAKVTEIAMRATANACVGMHPSRIEAVAVPLAAALVDVVIGNEGSQQAVQKQSVEVPNYIVFELWNRILDEVEKEIPAANQIEVYGTCTRSDRRELMSEKWKQTISKPMPPKKI